MIIKGMGTSHATIPAMNEQEVINFLQSKLNLQLATIDENGARIIEDHQKVVSMAEKINIKYLGTLEHPLAKMLMEFAQNGTEILLEISPKFFSTWDFAKAYS